MSQKYKWSWTLLFQIKLTYFICPTIDTLTNYISTNNAEWTDNFLGLNNYSQEAILEPHKSVPFLPSLLFPSIIKPGLKNEQEKSFLLRIHINKERIRLPPKSPNIQPSPSPPGPAQLWKHPSWTYPTWKSDFCNLFLAFISSWQGEVPVIPTGCHVTKYTGIFCYTMQFFV